MKTKFYSTPQEAEAAFYEAFEQIDVDAMMAVWSNEEDVVCIHPQGVPIAGYEAVRESWRQIFNSGQKLRFRITPHHAYTGLMLSVQVVLEHARLESGEESPNPVLATNVYMRSDKGWRMILHHASASPAQNSNEPDDPGRVLH
ncbi:MAG: nuclear transport factor 2 family protein [Burkholderiales bacterium]